VRLRSACLRDWGFNSLHRHHFSFGQIRLLSALPNFMDTELRDAIHKVLEGFDKEVFIRNTAGDTESAWALKLFPYLRALAVLAQATEYKS
jgi:hypothetical protein